MSSNACADFAEDAVPTLPSGIVTFLFTDVEGSTQLLERHPAAYRDAITSHLAMLGEAVASHRGRVFETLGDAVFAAFHTPSEAIAAAVRAQRALTTGEWGDIAELKVRMGLQTGDVEPQGEHYFGPALYRCARLTAAAHGGQVLISSATAELVHGALPPGATLRDLGEHRLKDLQRAERIFQVLAPGLVAEFPPLRTLGEFPNNLPVQPTPFIGREREVAAARRLLERPEVRVLTLSGPGGVGKTRLSLQIAVEALHEFRDGAFFVELASIGSADLVVSTIAKTLGVREIANREILDSLKDYLRKKRLLLVLDNFEHVITAGAHVADLVAACQGVKILVTSREHLHLRAEQQFVVPPMALPEPSSHVESVEELTSYEAVRLLIDRAHAVRADLAIGGHNVHAIAQICRRLDGIPLAIELAAARTNVFSPQALLARLEHRLAVLTGGPRDLPLRLQTLREAIGWSHDLLRPDEQALYRRVAVFVGGCTLSAAEAVVGRTDLELDTLAGLTSLIDKSLLRPEEPTDDEPRFRMLETIREHALDRLVGVGEGDEFCRRHADYFLSFVERAEPGLIGASQAVWLDRIEKEHDNLRAALQWFALGGPADHGLRLAAALRRFWRARGYLTEGRERMAVLLSLPEAANRTPSRAKALHGAGWLASQQGDYDDARVLLEESLTIYRELRDPRGSGWALVDLGFLARYRGDYVTGQSFLEESLKLFRQTKDPEGAAYALGNLGLIVRDQGDYEEAEARLKESLALWSDLGDRFGYGWTLTALGMVARAQGRRELARAHLEESLTVSRELSDRQNTANVLGALAALARDQEEYEMARSRLRESLAILRDIGDRRGIAFVLEGFACLAAAENQPRRAISLAATAEALRRIIGAPPPPTWRADVERSVEIAKRILESDAVEKATERGHAMTLDAAMTFALEAP
jgi:predicted ATPase/class 3 adenylate cyclase